MNDAPILNQLAGMNIKVAEIYLTNNLYRWRHVLVNGERRQVDKDQVHNRINITSFNNILLSYWVG